MRSVWLKRGVRWKWVLAFLLMLFSVPGFARAQESTQRPNVVLIVADDLGYMDVAAYAAELRGVPRSDTYYETPNIDRLLDEGLSFSHAYVHQLCSPTRVALLTGRNAAEIGFMTAAPANVRTYYNTGMRPPPGYHPQDAIYHSDPIELPKSLRNGSSLTALPSGQPQDAGRDAVTIAEALVDYRSAFAGKWHVGGHGAKGYQPYDQGFETLAFYDGGASPYFDWRNRWNEDELRFAEMPQKRFVVGKAGSHSDADYLTQALTQEAVHFLEERAEERDGPFFLMLSHFAVHGPMQAPEDVVDYFASKPERGWNGHRHATYAAMLHELDASVGAVMETLESTGLDENTLIIFMSDNGGVNFVLGREELPSTSNAPLKGGKATLYEGGIRVPLIVWWNGEIEGGGWSHVPVHVTDLFPTLLDVAGYDASGYDGPGRSLVPLFADPENMQDRYRRETFYWHYPFNVRVQHPEDDLPLTPHSAIRDGDYKLIVDWHGRLRLYDLASDPYEKHDLSEAEPERVRTLFAKLTDWMDQNVAPRYVASPNPAYDPADDPRAQSYRDLRALFESGSTN